MAEVTTMANRFLEKIAPYYFLLSAFGCVSMMGTLFGVIVFVVKGKQLQQGTRSLYLAMALWTILINVLVYVVLGMIGGDPEVATQVEAM
jgi:hypothetical protein